MNPILCWHIFDRTWKFDLVVSVPEIFGQGIDGLYLNIAFC
jgi:hypothetical protein